MSGGVDYGLADVDRIGAAIAPLLRAGDMIGLSGDLGAGKTTLARAILVALGLEGEAPSPSFAIVQSYDAGELSLPLWHVDLYRLDDPAEIAELGLEDARLDHALIVEWPERMGGGGPDDMLCLHISETGEGDRRLTARVPAAWKGRWPFPT